MKSESFKFKPKWVEPSDELKQAIIALIQSKFEIEANKQFWDFMAGDPITEKDVYGQTHEK